MGFLTLATLYDVTKHGSVLMAAPLCRLLERGSIFFNDCIALCSCFFIFFHFWSGEFLKVHCMFGGPINKSFPLPGCRVNATLIL